MAKMNNRPENNFFTQNINRYGDNFLDFLNSRDIQNGAITLFRNIAKRRVNLDKYGSYFTFSQFLDPCIEAARSEYERYFYVYQSMMVAASVGALAGPGFAAAFDYHKRCFEAYGIILQQLSNIKMDGDVAHMQIMANALSNYKNNI